MRKTDRQNEREGDKIEINRDGGGGGGKDEYVSQCKKKEEKVRV